MLQWLLCAADRARQRARARSWPSDQAAGRLGEDLAHRFLERLGWTIAARNYRPRSGHGEIDLVGWDGDTLVFVEVKSRHSAEFGDPDRNVDQQKRRALFYAAMEYARRADVPRTRPHLRRRPDDSASPAPRPHSALYRVLHETGLRISETVTLPAN